MRLLFLGDIVGRAGRVAIIEQLPDMIAHQNIDFVAINGENAAGGFGITEKIVKELCDAGADIITLGNHAWDQKGTAAYIETDPRLVRARNYPKGTPGSGGALHTLRDGRKVFVFQVLTQLFMAPIDKAVEEADGDGVHLRLT